MSSKEEEEEKEEELIKRAVNLAVGQVSRDTCTCCRVALGVSWGYYRDRYQTMTRNTATSD